MKPKTNQELHEQLITAMAQSYSKGESIPRANAKRNFNIARARLDYTRNHFLDEYSKAETDESREFVMKKFIDRIAKLKDKICANPTLETTMQTRYIDMYQSVIHEIESFCSKLESEKNPTLKDTKPNESELPPPPVIKSPFSVLEWATIFYYADETKLFTESRLLKTRLEQFMSKHQVNTTPVNFKNSYYEAKRRINKKNDYPTSKLELIIPFLKENYKQTVTKVENDIIFLEENTPDY